MSETGTTGSAADVPVTAQSSGEPNRRLSPWRVSGVVLVAVALVVGAVVGLRGSPLAGASVPQSYFAAYVDVTATPQYAFEGSVQSSATNAVLAFIVSDPDDPCEPSWGGAYSLGSAADALDLDRRVARLRQLDGEVTVSFGGAANSELSIGCTDTADLTAAFREVADRYEATAIDLDIEGAAASTPEVSRRRAEAIAALLSDRPASANPLAVWLTLPTASTGLSADGRTVLEAMLAAGVDIAGVNAMTMDYGETLPAGGMSAQDELALSAVHEQLAAAYAAIGTPLSDSEVWQRIGATPMIGQNDIAGEIFTVEDGAALVAFARLHQLRRLSMWSANRDQDCGPNYPDARIVSDACSGVDQAAGDFAAVFREFGAGTTPPADTPTASPSASPTRVPPRSSVVDDPATSPYAIWAPDQPYPQGTKIVWHRNVYEAKWYSVGDEPDAPVAAVEQTPWALIGPVLPGERPAPLPTVTSGTYPEWTPVATYRGGDRVVLESVAYEAKWWTQGDVPGTQGPVPGASPWQLVTPP